MTMETWLERQNSKRRYYMPSGSKIRKQFVLNIDDNGCECLVHCSNHDQYTEIQSYRDGCDLHVILNQLDPMAVNRYVSTYSASDIINAGVVDIATMPHTYGDMFNLVKKGESFFNGLPEAIRKEFNYSVKLFCSSFGTDKFNNIFAQYINSQFQQQEPAELVEPAEPAELAEPVEPAPKRRGRPPKNQGGNE